MLAIAWLALRRSLADREAGAAAAINIAGAHDIVLSRCSMCHSDEPVWPGITAPPQDVLLDGAEKIKRHARLIEIWAVRSRAMPPGNITQMTDQEREIAALVAPARRRKLTTCPPQPSGSRYPRDMIGYGRNPPDPRWPGGARIACSSSSTTRKAARTTSCMATPPRKRSCPSSRRAALAGAAPHEHGVDLRIWRRAPASGGSGGCSPSARCRSRSSAWRPRWRATRSGRGDARGGLGNRQPRPQMDRLQGHAARRTSAPSSPRRSASTPR